MILLAVAEPISFLFVLIALITAGMLGIAAATRGRGPQTISEGRQLLDAGELEAARRVFEKLARQRSRAAPGREAAIFWLGRTFEELGRKVDARRCYLKYLQDYDTIDGPRPTPQVIARVRERLAELLTQVPLAGSAWVEFAQGTPAGEAAEPQVLPDIRFVGIADGKKLMEAGRFDEARAVFERVAAQAAAGDPARESALYLLGLSQEALGDPTAARTTYAKFLDEHDQRARPGSARLKAQVDERLAGLESAAGLSPWERFQRADASRPKVTVTPKATTSEPSESQRVPVVPLEEVRKDLRRLDAGHRVGRYVIAEKLGEGGMGEVFRALRPVAIKFARSPEAIEHLRRFGTIQGAVDSPRVVKPLEVALDADPPYVVMEFVDGPTLRELLKARGALEQGLALPILLEVARGLFDAHKAGVMHLDLKPENVLLDGATGAVKLTDFELGRRQGESSQLRLSLSFRSTDAEALGGTLAYMSPEQRAGKVPDARSDVYTFGVLLFEALTGTLPEPGDRPSDFVPDLPAEVDQLFERCFARLEKRYVDARDLARDLEKALEKVKGRVDVAKAVAAVPRLLEEGGPPKALARRVEADRAAIARELASDLGKVEPAALTAEPEKVEAAKVEVVVETRVDGPKVEAPKVEVAAEARVEAVRLEPGQVEPVVLRPAAPEAPAVAPIATTTEAASLAVEAKAVRPALDELVRVVAATTGEAARPALDAVVAARVESAPPEAEPDDAPAERTPRALEN